MQGGSLCTIAASAPPGRCGGASRPRQLALIGDFVSRSTDPFLKKDWYDVKAPSMFSVRNVGKTLVTRTQGTKVFLYRKLER